MNAVEVTSLTFSYSEDKPILRDISFSLSKREIFVVAGISGSGKTTLCRILCGIIPHAIKGVLSGEISVNGTDPRRVSLPQAALCAGLVFQDADSQIICTTVEDEIAFGLENLCKPPDEIRRRVDELAEEFGFEKLCKANPSHLSDGQKKLLTIAAVLAPFPPVLILDEPMSGLDDESCALVVAAIEEQSRQGRTVIIVEHDLKRVMFADRWLLISGGTIAALGTPAELLRNEKMLAELGVWA